jgi:hypothetical protein
MLAVFGIGPTSLCVRVGAQDANVSSEHRILSDVGCSGNRAFDCPHFQTYGIEFRLVRLDLGDLV